jgi:hypothetical protein
MLTMIEVLITWNDEEGKCFALCCVMLCFAQSLADITGTFVLSLFCHSMIEQDTCGVFRSGLGGWCVLREHDGYVLGLEAT